MKKVFLLVRLGIASGLIAPRILFAESGLVFDQTQGTLTGQLNVSSNVAAAGSVTASSATLTNAAGAGLTVSSSAYLAVSGGNVGIGTTGPNSKLEVAGDIRVTSSGGATFVDGQTILNYTGIFVRHDTATANLTPVGIGVAINRIGTAAYFTNASGYSAIFDQGNVGIGITSPDVKLFVVNTVNANLLQIEGVSDKGLFFGDNANYIDIVGINTARSAFNPINFRAGASSHLFVNTDGKIGIGTTGPVTTLTINSGGAPVAGQNIHQRIIDTTSMAAGVGGRIMLGSYYTTSNDIADYASIAGIKENGTNGNYAGALVFSARPNGFLPAEMMRITSSGNVGIGTMGPNAKLHVVGESNTVVFPIRIAKGNYADTGGHTSLMGFGVENAVWSKGAVGYTRTGSYDTGYIGFYLNSAANTTDVSTSDVKMIINNNGNAGIGSVSPASLLELKSAAPILTINGTDNAQFKGINFATNGSVQANILSNIQAGELKIQSGTSGFGGFITFNLDGSEKVRIQATTGNVGIGTPAPAAKLDVNGNVSAVSGFFSAAGDTSSLGANAIENFYTTTSNGAYLIHIYGNTDAGYAAVWIVYVTAGGINAVKIGGHPTLSLEQAAASIIRLRITSGHSGQTYHYIVTSFT